MSKLADLERLAHEATAFARTARAPATLRAYTSDLADFGQWCTDHGLASMPADASTVALYVTDRASTLRPSTITRRLAAISVAHQHAGLPSPTSDPAVRTVTRGIRRRLGTATTEAAPLTIGDLRQVLAHVPDNTLGIRDRALLLVGFAGALRRSELVDLDVDDLSRHEQGYVAIVRRSKTDQEGHGHTIALPHGHDRHTCPVRAIDAWLEQAAATAGPLLRPVDRHGSIATHRLSAQAVNLAIKRAVSRAGLDPTAYSGHSLRAGFATSAAAAGASERSIANQTGHRSMEVLRRYVRHGSIFVDNAVGRLGL